MRGRQQVLRRGTAAAARSAAAPAPGVLPEHTLRGAGLGLRRELLPALEQGVPEAIDFFEVAPENWLELGGASGRRFRAFAERHVLVAHGLSLSLGGPGPLDTAFLRRVRGFLDTFRVPLYSEHLAYTTDHGHLYDLLPIPFTGEAVRHVARRICRTQDILGRRIAVENASYYVACPDDHMSEAEFIRAVLDEADCHLHLDVNNVFVNSVNHGYDARDFIRAMPAGRVVYLHVAGHYRETENLLVDTHGSDVCDPVWDLLAFTYAQLGVRPTLLERDFRIPPLWRLSREVARIGRLQAEAARPKATAARS